MLGSICSRIRDLAERRLYVPGGVELSQTLARCFSQLHDDRDDPSQSPSSDMGEKRVGQKFALSLRITSPDY
jgi:hypothetical protein